MSIYRLKIGEKWQKEKATATEKKYLPKHRIPEKGKKLYLNKRSKQMKDNNQMRKKRLKKIREIKQSFYKKIVIIKTKKANI